MVEGKGVELRNGAEGMVKEGGAGKGGSEG